MQRFALTIERDGGLQMRLVTVLDEALIALVGA